MAIKSKRKQRDYLTTKKERTCTPRRSTYTHYEIIKNCVMTTSSTNSSSDDKDAIVIIITTEKESEIAGIGFTRT